MKVQLLSVDLIGGGRRVEFQPGLNIITGPISTGKTTFLRLCRALLSTGLNMSSFPREAREYVNSVGGQVLIGDSRYSIVRPLVSTETAKVDIAGPRTSWRLPADRPDRISQITYGQWLLQTLGLPELRVPSAPTRPESEPTPITINDYLLYCRLTQDEIDTSVFAHSDQYKNIKRKYVFEIIYGLYSPEVAILQENLRDVQARIRQLNVATGAFQQFFEGTPWGNRAELIQHLDQAEHALEVLELESVNLVDSEPQTPPLQQFQAQLRTIDNSRQQKRDELLRTQEAVEQLNRLLRQLDSQIGKLTRSIVADSYLRDLEFLVCPRCATAVDVSRANNEVCGLCLQVPVGRSVDRSTLIAEQDRLGSQVQETRELIDARENAVARIEQELLHLDKERSSISNEVDYLTRTFVSDRAAEIAGRAAERSALVSRVAQLKDYLSLFEGLNRAIGDLAILNERRQELEAQLNAASMATDAAQHRVQRLDSEFAALVARFKLPRLEGSDEVRIDRGTYLPILFGRRFGELSSQGLHVLVNVAHAIAHHRTSIALELGLPQILFIDGLTSNLGHEDEDLERVNAVYDYLIELSENLGDQLQLIIADNDVPPQAQRFIRLRLDENERLIQPEPRRGP